MAEGYVKGQDRDFDEPDRAVNGVQAQLSRLATQVESAHELLGIMEKRLGPILDSRDIGGDSDMKAVESPRSEVSAQVISIQGQVALLIERMHSVNDRVAL